jgi:hypothetical protein
MLAIISRAVYERDMPNAQVGEILPIHEYRSATPALRKLDSSSRLFLVTVRPPDEQLWLVAVLTDLSFDGTKWNAKANTLPVRDITELKGSLRFANGKGLKASPGRLGMALQTPRVLAPDDSDLMLGAAPTKKVQPEAVVNLNAHSKGGTAPCLCKGCLPSAPNEVTVKGVRFLRRSAAAKGRVVHFWAPEDIADEPALIHSVRAAMTSKLGSRGKKQPPAKGKSTANRMIASEPVPARPESAAEAKAPTGLLGWLSRIFKS